MTRIYERRPSPAMVVALIALFVALSGTTFAALKVDSGDIADGTIVSKDLKNKKAVKSPDVVDGSLRGIDVFDGSLGSADVADGSLGSGDIADGSLVTGDLADNAVNGSKVANGSLTGDDVVESSLGKVPLATSADSAEGAAVVGTPGEALSPHKLFTKIPTGTAATTVLEVGGLKLTAACGGGGALTFQATTTVDDSIFRSDVENADIEGGANSSNFDSGATLDVMAGLVRGAGSFTYSQPNGTFVSGVFQADDSSTFGGTFAGCVVVGFAFSG